MPEVFVVLLQSFLIKVCLVRYGRARPGDRRRPAINLAGKLMSELIADNPRMTWHPHHSDQSRGEKGESVRKVVMKIIGKSVVAKSPDCRHGVRANAIPRRGRKKG